jgi:hypothetical protein
MRNTSTTEDRREKLLERLAQPGITEVEVERLEKQLTALTEQDR